MEAMAARLLQLSLKELENANSTFEQAKEIQRLYKDGKNVNEQQKDKILGQCQGNPLVLKDKSKVSLRFPDLDNLIDLTQNSTIDLTQNSTKENIRSTQNNVKQADQKLLLSCSKIIDGFTTYARNVRQNVLSTQAAKAGCDDFYDGTITEKNAPKYCESKDFLDARFRYCCTQMIKDDYRLPSGFITTARKATDIGTAKGCKSILSVLNNEDLLKRFSSPAAKEHLVEKRFANYVSDFAKESKDNCLYSLGFFISKYPMPNIEQRKFNNYMRNWGESAFKKEGSSGDPLEDYNKVKGIFSPEQGEGNKFINFVSANKKHPFLTQRMRKRQVEFLIEKKFCESSIYELAKDQYESHNHFKYKIGEDFAKGRCTEFLQKLLEHKDGIYAQTDFVRSSTVRDSMIDFIKSQTDNFESPEKCKDTLQFLLKPDDNLLDQKFNTKNDYFLDIFEGEKTIKEALSLQKALSTYMKDFNTGGQCRSGDSSSKQDSR